MNAMEMLNSICDDFGLNLSDGQKVAWNEDIVEVFLAGQQQCFGLGYTKPFDALGKLMLNTFVTATYKELASRLIRHHSPDPNAAFQRMAMYDGHEERIYKYQLICEDFLQKYKEGQEKRKNDNFWEMFISDTGDFDEWKFIGYAEEKIYKAIVKNTNITSEQIVQTMPEIKDILRDVMDGYHFAHTEPFTELAKKIRNEGECPQ